VCLPLFGRVRDAYGADIEQFDEYVDIKPTGVVRCPLMTALAPITCRRQPSRGFADTGEFGVNVDHCAN